MAWMRWRRWSEVELEEQRGQVQVKWKPDCRWDWRMEVGSRGEVSIVISLEN